MKNRIMICGIDGVLDKASTWQGEDVEPEQIINENRQDS